jgi:sugar/nucleoside kinase (ribokinase family)
MRSVVVAGHVCVDFIPELREASAVRPGERLKIGPLTVQAGGCVANTGGDLAALGAGVQVVAHAGDDELGALLVALLRSRGTRTDQIRLLDGRSTSYSLVFEPGGQDRAFWHHVGANAEFGGSAVDPAAAAVLHVGHRSLLPALIAGGGAPLAALLERARAAGVTTSLDLAAIDPASPAAREDWPRLLERVLPLVDVFSPASTMCGPRCASAATASIRPRCGTRRGRCWNSGRRSSCSPEGRSACSWPPRMPSGGGRPARCAPAAQANGVASSTSSLRRRSRFGPRSGQATRRPPASSMGSWKAVDRGRRSSWRRERRRCASAGSGSLRTSCMLERSRRGRVVRDQDIDQRCTSGPDDRGPLDCPCGHADDGVGAAQLVA